MVPRPRRLGRSPSLHQGTVTTNEASCLLTVDAGRLRLLSNTLLQRRGMGAASPVVVQAGGSVLSAGDPASCDGSFRFDDDTITVGSPAAGFAPDALSVALSAEVPLPTADGPVWWLYPRTALEIPVAPVSGQAGQVATLTVSARALGAVREAVQLRVGALATPLAGERMAMQATLPVTLGEGGWSVMLDAPRGSNYLIVDTLILSLGGEERDLLAEVL